jgi:hypothetical protein
MTNMKDVNAEKSLIDCNPRDDKNSVNIDPVPEKCADDCWPSQKRVVNTGAEDWGKVKTFNKLGLGQHWQCDPIQTGQIVNDLDTPNRDVIYRYSRSIRACDEAMLDLFRNMIVLDEQGKQHTVPIIWASQEKAVAYLLQDNTRKDNSLVVDRIRLPIVSIWNAGIQFDQSRFTYQKAYTLLPWLTRDDNIGFFNQEKFYKDTFYGVTRGIPVNTSYTLYMWALYEEDMNQMLEQVFTKFSPVAYLQVKGVWWEVIVTLDNTSNNIDLEPGDSKVRVIKYQINMTAKTYIAQPIYRLKERPKDFCREDHDCDDPDRPNFMGMSDEEIKSSIEELKKGIAALEESMKAESVKPEMPAKL